ncbi:MAG: glutaredoxin family protein [Gammaproteobacteria bacterium]|nr:glutaredoxin family protein [Gammaproteobacteria bacterium]
MLRLYWQPGCTSCLRAREFLRTNGVEFESVNVRADPQAYAELQALGLRTVPVLARGADYVLAQDIDEVAAFVGLSAERARLPVAELCARLTALLSIAERQIAEIPEHFATATVPGRDRRWLDLAFHLPMIVRGFLEAAAGGELAYEFYEREAPPRASAPTAVARLVRQTRTRFTRWQRRHLTDPDLPARTLRTYFGAKRLDVVLERTTWHVAQHCRQLEDLLVRRAGVQPTVRLDRTLLEGLPLPQNIWDPEPGAAC